MLHLFLINIITIFCCIYCSIYLHFPNVDLSKASSSSFSSTSSTSSPFSCSSSFLTIEIILFVCLIDSGSPSATHGLPVWPTDNDPPFDLRQKRVDQHPRFRGPPTSPHGPVVPELTQHLPLPYVPAGARRWCQQVATTCWLQHKLRSSNCFFSVAVNVPREGRHCTWLLLRASWTAQRSWWRPERTWWPWTTWDTHLWSWPVCGAKGRWEGEEEEYTLGFKFQKVLLWWFLAFKLLGCSLQIPEKLHVARWKEEGVGRKAARREQMLDEFSKSEWWQQKW